MINWKLVLVLFFSIGVSSCVFFGPSTEKLFVKALENKPYDIIIVPGFPFDSAAKEWPIEMRGRIYWAKYLFDIGITKNVLFSGGAVYTPYKECEIMSLYGEAIGIPSTNIFKEPKAEHSTENIYYGYFEAKRLGFEKIAIATDPFQAKFTRRIPKMYKIDADFIPFVIDTLATLKQKSFVEINANAFLEKNFVSIEDRQSRFKRYWGTLGKNIVRDELDMRKKKIKQQ